MINQLLAAHANSGILNCQSPQADIRLQADLVFVIWLHQFRISQCLEAESIQGVRNIGNELSQKDLSLYVERMDHETEKSRRLSLELDGFNGWSCQHRGLSVSNGV
jgi:hypothetical protein